MSQAKTFFEVTEATSITEILAGFLASEDLLLVDSRSVITNPHLELLSDYPRKQSAALVGVDANQTDTLVRAGKVVSASSSSHGITIGNRLFSGVLLLSGSQREQIEAALTEAAAAGLAGHALDLVLVALVRYGIEVEAVELRGASFSRSNSEKVRAEHQKLSEARLRLNLANRANDGFFSVMVLRRFSKLVTWLAIKVGATPNQITLLSFLIGLFAAYLFAQGDPGSVIAGALLLQLSIVVDCVDGELARYTRKFSELGAWLDAITDRVKEYAVFFGLAWGAFFYQGQNLWLIAIAMMALQTFRHLSDYNFAQVIKARRAEQEITRIAFTSEGDGITADESELAVKSQSRLRRRLRYWAGKIITFPIGERWLIISLSAALGGAELTFTLLPLLALFSLIWVYRMRLLKSIELPAERISSAVIALQLDLPLVKQSLFKRLDWLEPSLLRAIELGFLILLFAFSQNLGPSAFVIVFAISYHHYDNLYRAMQSEAKPEWLALLGYSVIGRMAFLAIAVYLGWNLDIFAIYFAVLFLVVGSIQWVSSHKKS